MREFKEYQVFIASPGDVERERSFVRNVCSQFNQDTLVHSHRIAFNAVGWEDVIPAAGRPQQIINRLVEDCDIFVCIFHKRLGTPSGKAKSGTLEEFWLAYESWKDLKKPDIFFYFKDVQIRSAKELTDPQLVKVLELKDKIETDKLLLFGTFATPDDFEMIFTKHMKDWIAEKTRPKDTSGKPAAKISLEIPDAYRKWITEHSQHMDLDKLREKSDVIQVKLPEIFVPLYANDPEIEKSEQLEMEGRQFSKRSTSVDIEGLAAKYDYLLVEGVAGSGKTTLIKHMAYLMIQNKGFIGGDNLLPVLIFLKDLKGFDLSAGAARAGDPPSAEKILSYYFKKTENGLDLELVKAFCKPGKAVFLIDGLDEIDAGLRETVANAFGNLRNRLDATRLIITGRPHGIDDTVIKRFGERHVKILPFTMEQVEDFITRWFWHVYDPQSRIGKKTTQGMISDIKAHPGTEKLIDNPLMLTAICILYHDERELPDQRAELYKKFVNNLLFRRFKDEHERVHAFLKQLGFEMFTKGDRGIDRSPAVSILGREYPRSVDESDSEYRKRLKAKFDEIEPSCGLLTFQDGQYNFRHLTLQEFLTATAIVDRETDYGEAIKGYWGNERCKEVIELYVGYLSIENKRWANKIVQEILNHNDDKPFSRWRLAARALLDMHKDRREIDVVDLAAERLRHIIHSEAGTKDRAEAGQILGRLGDRRDLEKFVPIKSEKYETSQGKIKIENLEIGAYPVINQWFEKFLKEDGYSNNDWWSKEGKKWRDYTEAKYPAYWYERMWNCPNAPVVGVCWYEADAFARWLTSAKNDGYKYRLPDEKEWEAAAAGVENRQYPWGNDWRDDCCNTDESGLNQTSCVGIFKNGNTPDGVADLSGNVWEWTCSDYRQKQERDDFRFDEEAQKLFDEENWGKYYEITDDENRQIPVLRGGSWANNQDFARCADRYRFNPHDRNLDIGFRCVRTK